MKTHLNILFFTILLFVIGTSPISAQIVDEQGQYVDTVFHDNVDRTAEDFVIASLLVADPGTYMYSVLGHACLRLQCPAFGMDYCFTYESEDESKKVLSFLAGKLMMGLFAIPTETYCAFYREEGRGVCEYKLNLPIEAKRELWRILDENLARNTRLPYDYYHRGCAITAQNFVQEALGTRRIVYDQSLYEESFNAREIWIEATTKALWVRFIALFIMGSETSSPLKGEKKLLVPNDLVLAWQKATVNGEPLLASEPIVLVEGEPQIADVWFTPMVLAVILFVLAIANLFWNRPYFDWLMLVAQTFVGCGMTYLIVFSDLCCTEWNWLFIPFNPLPAIFWRWRKYWALPCAVVLMIWSIVMSVVFIWGHALEDWSQIVMVVAWMVVLLKQYENYKCIKIFIFK